MRALLSSHFFTLSSEKRSLLSVTAFYIFILFFLLPLFSALLLPAFLGLSPTPFADLSARFNESVTSGFLSFILLLCAFLLTLRLPRIFQNIFIFLLLPISLTSLVTQAILYQEFGADIDYHLIGLFKTTHPRFGRMDAENTMFIG